MPKLPVRARLQSPLKTLFCKKFVFIANDPLLFLICNLVMLDEAVVEFHTPCCQHPMNMTQEFRRLYLSPVSLIFQTKLKLISASHNRSLLSHLSPPSRKITLKSERKSNLTSLFSSTSPLPLSGFSPSPVRLALLSSPSLFPSTYHG